MPVPGPGGKVTSGNRVNDLNDPASQKPSKHNQRKVRKKDASVQESIKPSFFSKKNQASVWSRIIKKSPVTGWLLRRLNKTDQSCPDTSLTSFDAICLQGTRATSLIEAKAAIKSYFQELNQNYKENPPEGHIKEDRYQDIVKMSAHALILLLQETQSSTESLKIGSKAELKQQLHELLHDQSSAVINTQVSTVLDAGMLTPESQKFLFEDCLNLQKISGEKHQDNIDTLEAKLARLETEMTNTEPDDAYLQKRTQTQNALDNLKNKQEKLIREKENKNMHSQQDFFQDCYDIVMKNVDADFEEELKKQPEMLERKARYDIDLSARLTDKIMREIDQTLQEKARFIANDTANRKKEITQNDVYQQKKEFMTNLVRNEIDRILGRQQSMDNNSLIAIDPDKITISIDLNPDTAGSDSMKNTETGSSPLESILIELQQDSASEVTQDPQSEVLSPESIAVHLIYQPDSEQGDTENGGIDLDSIEIAIDDSASPDGQQVDEWMSLLFNRLSEDEQRQIDANELRESLTQKSVDLGIRGGMIKARSSESPFVRNSPQRRARRWGNKTRVYQASQPISVTEALKSAIHNPEKPTGASPLASVEQEDIFTSPVPVKSMDETANTGSVSSLVRFFESVIEQHRMESDE